MGGMERRDLEEIERFVASLGHRTPLAYYGLSEDASPEAIDSAIKKRRTWAQGQQANPKYRTEALFLIKSNANLRKLLVDERELYHETFSGVDQKLAELNAFVTTTLQGADGTLPPRPRFGWWGRAWNWTKRWSRRGSRRSHAS